MSETVLDSDATAADATADAGSDTGGEEASKPFHETLSEDTRKLGDFSKFASSDDIAKSYANLEAKLGSDTVIVPGDNATPEQRSEFYGKIGRPEKSSDYQLPSIEGLPDGAIPDARVNEFRSVAHEIGLTQPQVARLMAWHGGAAKDDIATIGQAQEDQARQWQGQVRQEHGTAYDQVVNMSNRAIRDLNIPGLSEALKSTGAANHPAFVNLFHKVARMTAQDTIVAGEGSGFKMGPEAARQELARQAKDTKFMEAYHDKRHADHSEARRKRSELFQQAHPEPAA